MKRFGRLPPWLGACVALLLAPWVPATTVIQPSFEKLVDSADYIVRGVVTDVTSSWRDDTSQPGRRYISSQVTLEVLEVIKGTPPEPLVLRVMGGRIGDAELVVDGAPRFVAGQESILFVRNNGQSFFPLVGLMHGYFPVMRDQSSGRAEVLRFNGRPLLSEQELSPDAPAPARGRAAAIGMTPQAFRDRIQSKQTEILSREKLR